jgi:hypothetical protein
MKNLNLVIIPEPYDLEIPKPPAAHEWCFSVYRLLLCRRLLYLVDKLKDPFLEVQKMYGPYYNRNTALIMMDRERRQSQTTSMILVANVVPVETWNQMLPYSPV